MPFVAVICVVLLFFTALAHSCWWRVPLNQPGYTWYGNVGNSAFYWGIFALAVFLTWSTIKPLL